ncbi:MAG: hypothetical protein ACYTEQ_29420 [Planctomycetota bacterium]
MNVKRILLVVVLVGMAATTVVGPWFAWEMGKKIDFPLLLRDVTIATIANHKSGDEMPIEIDYILSGAYPPQNTWAIQTNSLYLGELTRRIVPYFIYEGVLEEATEVYPQMVYVSPQRGYRSFHILGTAGDDVVMINERFIIEEARLDGRQMLATMVHELTHLQKGKFYGGPPHWEFPNVYEANTQAVTIEVLAGMCYHSDEMACNAFWEEIFSYSRGAVRMRLRRYKLESLYEPLSSFLWYDEAMEHRAEKSMRYWNGHEDRKRHLYEIVYMYQQAPWDNILVPGILGEPLDTGLEGECADRGGEIVCKPMTMPFDDTQAMIGGFLQWFIGFFS